MPRKIFFWKRELIRYERETRACALDGSVLSISAAYDGQVILSGGVFDDAHVLHPWATFVSEPCGFSLRFIARVAAYENIQRSISRSRTRLHSHILVALTLQRFDQRACRFLRLQLGHEKRVAPLLIIRFGHGRGDGRAGELLLFR